MIMFHDSGASVGVMDAAHDTPITEHRLGAMLGATRSAILGADAPQR
jgi:hypothetical protein